MTFLATLFALLIERFFDWSHLRRWQWFTAYEKIIAKYCARFPAAVTLTIVILVPVILVAVVQCSLTGIFYDIFKLLFATAVLLYCLGPQNFWADRASCLSQLQNPEYLQQQWHITSPYENSQTFHQLLLNQFILEYYYRIFAILFWFALLGPVGAVLYRMIDLAKANPATTRPAELVQNGLDWIPVRILTAIFCLAGNFTTTIVVWEKNLWQGLQLNKALLTQCGLAAANIKPQEPITEEGSAEKSVLALLDRSLVITVVCLALIVLSI